MVVHLVMYSNGEPYDTTKKLSIKSIHQHSKKKIIIHDYNLNKIKKKTMVSLFERLAFYT